MAARPDRASPPSPKASGLSRRWRKKKIDVVVNPNSGKGKGHDETKRTIVKMLLDDFPDSQQSAADVRVFHTRNLRDLDKAHEEIKRVPPDFLVIIGGDGTAQQTLGKDEELLRYLHAHERPPLIVVIDLGTYGTIAKTLGISPRDPIKAVATFIDKVKRGVPLDTVHRHILQVNDQFGFIFAAGLPDVFLRKYNEKSPRGFKRVVLALLWIFWNEFVRLLPFSKRRSAAHGFNVAWTFESDGAVIGQGEGQATGIVASSLEQVGMGCKVTRRALERVEHFHVILSNLGWWKTLFNAPSMFLSLPLKGDTKDEVVTAVSFTFKEPLPWIFDGEEKEPTERIVCRRGPLCSFVRLTP